MAPNKSPSTVMSSLKLKDFPLSRFYIVLIISVANFLAQLIGAHVTHSLILQLDSYHMLYNILSLGTCITTVQLGRKGSALANTFGWTRLDVVGAVANLCFLAALCFSVVVECLQTIFHASHHEKMHYPLLVAALGAVGLIVNVICFFVIGGYTFHQRCFLGHSHGHMGDDLVISSSVQAYVRRGMKNRRRQGFVETFRDSFGSMLVVIVATIVDYVSASWVDYVDPGTTIFSVILLSILSYTYAKEAGRILLLTIPDHINVKSLVQEMNTNFPEIRDIHDFHVWQLTPSRIVASAHIVLDHPHGYLTTQNNVIDFLHNKGISHVTLQPEFRQLSPTESSPENLRKRKCFLICEQEDCVEKQCCANDSDSHNLEDDSDDEYSDDDEPHEVISSSINNVALHQISSSRVDQIESADFSDGEREEDEPERQPMI